MIKSGHYALYKGKEYHMTSDEMHQIFIFTNNENLVDETFVKTDIPWALYEKIVQPYELDDVYRITTYAYVDGDRILGVMKETEDMVLVCANGEDEDLIEKYQLKEVDRYVYEGWIHKDDVRLVEERKDMTRQFGVVKKSRESK